MNSDNQELIHHIHFFEYIFCNQNNETLLISYVPVWWSLLLILFIECLIHLLFDNTSLYSLWPIVAATLLFTFECLIDVPPPSSLHWLIFRSFPPALFLFQLPRLFYQLFQKFSNPEKLFEIIYWCWHFCDLAKGRFLSVLCFVLQYLCNEANTLCFVL